MDEMLTKEGLALCRKNRVRKQGIPSSSIDPKGLILFREQIPYHKNTEILRALWTWKRRKMASVTRGSRVVSPVSLFHTNMRWSGYMRTFVCIIESERVKVIIIK